MAALKTPEIAWLRRYPWVTTFTVVALLTYIGAWLLWDRLPALEDELRQRTAEGEASLDAVASSPVLRAELTQVREAAQRIDTNLVDELAVDVNYGYFYSLEKRSQVRLSDLRPVVGGPPDPRVQYKHVSFSLRLTGSYEQVADFLQQIEMGPRLARITSFGIRRRGGGNMITGPDVDLDLNIDLLGKR